MSTAVGRAPHVHRAEEECETTSMFCFPSSHVWLHMQYICSAYLFMVEVPDYLCQRHLVYLYRWFIIIFIACLFTTEVPHFGNIHHLPCVCEYVVSCSSSSHWGRLFLIKPSRDLFIYCCLYKIYVQLFLATDEQDVID